MTPRSLVGMTMGARKRAALYQSLYNQDTSHITLTNKQLRMVWRSVWPISNWARGERTKLRLPYRIGQRLRPCPGCFWCMPGVKGWHIDNVRGRYRMPTTAWCCEGSGVIPTRSKKVRR